MTDISNILFLIGRILLGGFFVLAGYNHFRNLAAMSGYAAMKGAPSPKLAVIGSGLLLLVGGLSLVTGLYPLIGIGALALFLVGATPMMHAYWKESDPMAKMGEKVNFQKNVALLGAVLALALVSDPWPLALSL